MYLDDRAFIFELTQKRKLNVNKNKKILGCYDDHLLMFNDCFALKDNCDQEFNTYISNNSTFDKRFDH